MTKKITALKAQKRDRQRVNVYLDGEFAFGLARIVAAWLRVGQELSEDQIKELQAQDGVEKATQRALNYLSYRPRSVAEVAQNLEKHGTPAETIATVIARLEELHVLDDQDFAALWVENRAAFRPRGRRALRLELRQKGIDEDTIENALEEIDEDALAYQAGQKKARQLQGLDWQEFRKKLTAFLSRRGFNYSVVSPAVQRLWDELHTQTDIEPERY